MFPTIGILHGLGEDKTAFEDTSATGARAAELLVPGVGTSIRDSS